MAQTRERLARRLRSEAQKTVEFFSALPPESWECNVYSDGGCWTVRQLLAHFVGAEAGMVGLMRSILAGGEGAPENFDLNHYNQSRVDRMQELSPEELLAQFAKLREESICFVETLEDDDLQRTGRHPWLGITPLEEIIQLLYRHNQIHQRDIRNVLGER